MKESVKLYLDTTVSWAIRIGWVMVVVGALVTGVVQVVDVGEPIWIGGLAALLSGAAYSLFVGLLYWVRGLLRRMWFPETE